MADGTAAASATKRFRVFISYAHRGDGSRADVLKLVNSLKKNGVEAVADLEQTPAQDRGWLAWARKEIDDADMVICIASEEYKRRWMMEEEAGVGKGSTYEAGLIQQRIFDSGGINSKFRAAAFYEEDAAFVPDELRRFKFFLLFQPDGFRELYAAVTGQQVFDLLPVGEPQTIEKVTTGPLFEITPAKRGERASSFPIVAGALIVLVALIVGIGYVALEPFEPDVRFRVPGEAGRPDPHSSGTLRLWRGAPVDVPIAKGKGSIPTLWPEWEGQTVWPALELNGAPRTPLPPITLTKGQTIDLDPDRRGTREHNRAPRPARSFDRAPLKFYLTAGQTWTVKLADCAADPDPGDRLMWDEITPAKKPDAPPPSGLLPTDFTGAFGHLRLSDDRASLLYTAWPQPQSGDDVFTTTVVDSWGAVLELSMSFVVSSSINRLPVADDMNAYCAPGKTISFAPAARDPDQPELVLVGVTPVAPEIGRSSTSGNQIVFFASPPPSGGATAKFQYTVRDNHGVERTAIVKVRIPSEEPECPDIIELTRKAGEVFSLSVIEERFRQHYICSIDFTPDQLPRVQDASSGSPTITQSGSHMIHYAPGTDGRISDTIRFTIRDELTRTPVRSCEIRVKFELP